MTLKVMLLHTDAILPTRSTEQSSGLDLSCLEDIIIDPNTTVLIRTGVAFEIPKGYEVQVRARSGLSLKTPFRLANGIGTIDADYTGECSVLGWNSGSIPIRFAAGTRIAQAVLCPIVLPEVITTDTIELTDRGDSGFGSSGV